jgi:hypothetical protein
MGPQIGTLSRLVIIEEVGGGGEGVIMSQPHFEGNVRSPLTFPKMGFGSPSGLPKI